MKLNGLIKKILKHAQGTLKNIYEPVFFFVSKHVPDRVYLEHRYKRLMGKKLNLDPPVTYNEKLNWMKLFDHNPLYTQLADKLTVRDYVREKIGDEYLIPIIGVWNKGTDIEFDNLPDKFVLKCTHDSGSVVICKDRNDFDIVAAKKHLDKALERNYFYYGREWAYKDIVPRVICEPYVEDLDNEELRDYKFFCFNGEVKFLYVATDRFNSDKDLKFTFFDPEYNHIPVVHGHPIADPLPEKPKGFEKMKELARILSKGINQVRVDFYEANGKILFSEFTFYNNGACLSFEPEKWDYTFGEWLEL